VSINKEDDFMVKIRLSRAGMKGRPFYHIVVADERAARDGRSIERLGYYNPVAAGKDVTLELNVPKAEAWMKKGAQPTDKVKYLLKQAAKLKPAAA
jgi:small subunit ribosomal protein S16